MNQTRALIEAIEAYTKGTDSSLPFKQRLATAREQWRALQAAISSAKAAKEGVETKWIDCEQGYPAMETKCLVLTIEPSVEIATMGMLEYWWMHKNYLRPDQVTHYLPIPAVPTEVREKEGWL